MKQVQVTKTEYVTDDGKSFQDEEKAREHEKELEIKEALKKFRVDGPNYLPDYYYPESLLLVPVYTWYMVLNPEEMSVIEKCLGKQYIPVKKYPELIGVSNGPVTRVVLLSEVFEVKKKMDDNWSEFVKSFDASLLDEANLNW